MVRINAIAAAGLGVLGALLAVAPPVYADPDYDGDPPFHILSSQELCTMAWPFTLAEPDPAQSLAVTQSVGTICVREGGVLQRASKALPAIFADTYPLKPGSIRQLPVGSTRVDPNDPLSDWIIPDCYLPRNFRPDCQ